MSNRSSNYEQLRAAIEHTNALVCAAAAVGFDPSKGDWSDRLLVNQECLAALLSSVPVPPIEVRLVTPETWWKTSVDGAPYSYTRDAFVKEEWKKSGLHVEDATPTPSQDGFLHRLIENAFSWALRDPNHLNPKYMDRLIAETVRGMSPEMAAAWNATTTEMEQGRGQPHK